MGRVSGFCILSPVFLIMSWVYGVIGILLVAMVAGLVYWLLRSPGRLTVYTIPAGVQVALDGRIVGTTADSGLVIEGMGEHFIELSRVGYETDTITVFLVSGKVLNREIIMQVPGMVMILGGDFMMGWDGGAYNEKPAHRVRLRPFYMDRTEVTTQAFRKFRPKYRPSFSGGEKPATNVSWQEAHDYCQFVGKRLPSEAEWERVCRGAEGSAYSYGQTYNVERGRTGQGLNDGPVAVNSFAPGNENVFAMTGNVWEWCADWYGRDYYQQSPIGNPRGPKKGTQRVVRGGAWYNNVQAARCTHRAGNVRKSRAPSFGFRCARNVE
jgi:hypothetical protein